MRRNRSPCCARAASGHTAALPSRDMNSRLLHDRIASAAPRRDEQHSGSVDQSGVRCAAGLRALLRTQLEGRYPHPASAIKCRPELPPFPAMPWVDVNRASPDLLAVDVRTIMLRLIQDEGSPWKSSCLSCTLQYWFAWVCS